MCVWCRYRGREGNGINILWEIRVMRTEGNDEK